MRIVTTVAALIVVCGTQAIAEGIDVDALRKDSLGKWERFAKFAGKPYRLIKDITEKEETLTVYALSGEATYQHKVKYEITVENNLAIFTYWDFTVTISEPGENAPAKDVRTKYVFRIKDGKWYQVSRMFGDAARTPQMQVWRRPQMPPKVIKELSYFVGNWTTEGRTGNVKTRGYWNAKWAQDYYCLSIDTGYESIGDERSAQSVCLLGWDAKKQKFMMPNFWSHNESYTLAWEVKSDTEWKGELIGVEGGEEFTTEVKLVKKSPTEFVYYSKNAAGEEIEVVFRK